ncbi:MAG: hypothetical protein JSU00_17505 [Acidobacteria bacterium]|nr:hypothetical protein [Acidobacteriota bacterium]
MKSTESAEPISGVQQMAMSRISIQRKTGGKPLGVRDVAPIPMEWMGPPAWRLPSGKALAEFALQAGFLAPLLLGDGPFWKRGGARQVERRQKLSDDGGRIGQ